MLKYINYQNQKLLVDKRLKSGSHIDDVIEIANTLDGEEIAFVGHQPEFSEHVSELISQSYAYIDFKKAAIAKINFYNKAKKGKGLLEFLIPPQIFKYYSIVTVSISNLYA